MKSYKDEHSNCIGFGPISGLSGVAEELMLTLGHDPDDHPELRAELEQAIGEETLNLGRQILAEHGLVVRD
ncbi:hypothetical protein [Saccharothrix hoggarensis]|uniref:Uncharacterized protein n=1 Tax=Saccharothrix hoggarensis TaxID=913853 RepID=A0ABW3QNG9_9PSEU